MKGVGQEPILCGGNGDRAHIVWMMQKTDMYMSTT